MFGARDRATAILILPSPPPASHDTANKRGHTTRDQIDLASPFEARTNMGRSRLDRDGARNGPGVWDFRSSRPQRSAFARLLRTAAAGNRSFRPARLLRLSR